MVRNASVVVLLLALCGAVRGAVQEDPRAKLVTIYRDDYGVPHIVGETEEATFFGYGYAQAEDHLERMMIQYRDAQGRRAEVEGFEALGDGYLHFIPYEYRWDGDYLQRLLRTKKAVVENRGKIDPAVYRILDAFAGGVNYYIAQHRSAIPAWIDGITAEDVEALERSQYMRFYSVHDALMKMGDATYSFPNFGSNQWAIARERSANGRIIHVEHTHMPWANRFQNYEAHLICPGKLDAAGISWFGSPVFLDGLNDRITWSATWNQPNISDVYEEKINPENRLQYLYDGKWRDIRVERETFRVKGTKGMESVTLPLYYTHHGPIVKFDREKNRAWSIRLPNFDGVNYTLGLYGIMKAGNLDEFRAAVARQLMPRWNLLYSDAANIYWVHNGNVAQRNPKFDWLKPVPGWTSETEWGPFVPFADYPQILNPASGFLQNCNNPYWVATKNSGLKPLEPAPYYLSHPVKAGAGEEALNTRGERLFQVLTQPRKFTLEEMLDLGFDTYVLGSEVFVPLLEKAEERHRGEGGEAAALAMKRIRAWDRRSSAESTAFSFVYYWAKAYEHLFGAAKYGRFNAYGRAKAIDTGSAEEQDMAWKALVEGANGLRKRFGKAEIAWGEINTVVRGGVFPMDGAGEMFGVLHPDEGPEQEDGHIRCNDGWGHLLVVMEGQPKQAWSLLPYGESENPQSSHFNDQAKLHSRRKAKRLWLTPAEILGHTESVWGDRGRLMRMTAAAQLKVHVDAPGAFFLSGSGGVEVQQNGADAVLTYPVQEVRPIENMHVIWADLLAHSDAATVSRLTQDPAFRRDSRRVTVGVGTKGFTLSIDQLLTQRTFRVPSLGVTVSAGGAAVPQPAGERVLDQVHRAPEATYGQFKAVWEDMGNPAYRHPAQQGPGHIVCLTWDSAIPKFGVDRGAGVWNDYGNPDRFRLWFGFGNLAEGIAPYWKGQRLEDGLPVITTTLEREGIRYEVEQFAFPLGGPPRQRTGDLQMVLLSRVRLTNPGPAARTVPVSVAHQRRFSEAAVEEVRGKYAFEDRGSGGTFLVVDGRGARMVWNGVADGGMKRIDVTLFAELQPGGSREFVVALPSPVVPREMRGQLAALDYASAREQTLAFWGDYVNRGAQFEVPEKAVNDLFRASLWHALRLPRRHEGSDGAVTLDLPYSNFAYDQHGTPWPVNQAVYVDSMLYDLRGYHGISAEEIEAIYRNNQEPSGRVSGFANWTVNTPGMLYAVAQNYLLSGDRGTFERLLPRTLRAMDWCLGQVRGAPKTEGPEQGLVSGPLNDLTGDGYWAFNQAYIYAGLDLFGKALARAGHPRAGECLEAAKNFRAAIERGFRMASVRSPLAPLRDGTWTPYVPCNATEAGRLFEQWYPTDVDTGAVHLLRLGALDASGDLADALLNDHEDNLYLDARGIANEPVYNQQATAYLLRDDAKAVIRAFYSYMASAFSHSVFEPVEHRWRWGQYFGPPSTDGAWFELYRNMLVRETEEGLIIGQAAPRAWLADGKQIHVRNAPTQFGNVSFDVESRAASGAIAVTLRLEKRETPGTVLVRLRHPGGKPMRSVTANGSAWTDFDPAKEWVRIRRPAETNYSIVASY